LRDIAVEPRDRRFDRLCPRPVSCLAVWQPGSLSGLPGTLPEM